jgi:hypothetical protein
MAGYFHLASADIQCKVKKSPEIRVSATDTVVRYDHSKTQKELEGFEIDTVSPYAAGIQTHVGGLMSGEVSVNQSIQFLKETYSGLNAGCLLINQIEVKVHIKPTIYIAKEYPKNGCMYAAVMEHEKKHIAVDRAIINKYSNMIGKGVTEAMSRIGYSHGPYRIGELEVQQNRVNDKVNIIIKKYADMMTVERTKLQQQVDSLAEYERVTNQCKGRR